MRTESKLSYPFTWSRKFSTQAIFSKISQDSPRINVQLNPFYVSGFADAEASFIVTGFKRPARDSKIGWGVRAQFQIVLHCRDLPLLEKIQTFFGVSELYWNRKLEIRHPFVYPLLKK